MELPVLQFGTAFVTCQDFAILTADVMQQPFKIRHQISHVTILKILEFAHAFHEQQDISGNVFVNERSQVTA